MKKSTSPAAKSNVYQIVTHRIFASLKSGFIPWEKPWTAPTHAGGSFPRNFKTGQEYRGINVLLLWSSPYSSPFWLTFKQALDLKGSVRKGEKGTQIIFYKQLGTLSAKDQHPTESTESGKEERVPFVLTYHTVFNVEQCENLEVPCDRAGRPTNRDRAARGLRGHRKRMGSLPGTSLNQRNRAPRILPPEHGHRAHATPVPLRRCAALLLESRNSVLTNNSQMLFSINS